jgi:hypothetical protein
MTTPVTLLLGVHAHQPVGNFPEVIDEAHQRCYRPFLETLHRFPEFRFAAHFSGWLLDYLMAKFPADMGLLRDMAARGQVELFGSGDCEPVLAAIPSRDRLGQLRQAAQKLHGRFGEAPEGAWLTERVWEATVVPALVDSGIRYVAVDDYHFLCAGRSGEELGGYFSTEEDGRTLDLFPISEALRYRIPFAPAGETLAYLEGLARQGQGAAVYFDDIEKFGIWPETYAWVYEQGWLEQFIRGVLASPVLRTATYRQFHAAARTRGVVYLPTTSYIEMNEWTLPAAAAGRYHALIEQEKAAGRFEQNKPFVRGGIWRNFLSRYPESNWMHKRMLGLSRRLAEVPEARQGASMQEKLYRAQANDAYWHGLFGGLYLPHLRRAVWNNLIALEHELDTVVPRSPLSRGDIDHDGHEEILLHNPHLQIALRLDGAAAPHELDAYALAHNFGDTLRKSPEHYHERIHRAREIRHDAAGIASAHDRVSFKHVIEPQDLVPDHRARGLFLDTWTNAEGKVRELAEYGLVQAIAPLHQVQFGCRLGKGHLDKVIGLEGAKLVAAYRHRQASARPGRLASRLNLAMPSCDGFLGRYVLEDGSIPGGFGNPLELREIRRLTLEDGVLGGALTLSASRPVDARCAPYHTVSLSEAGFEKIMQGVCIDLEWPLEGSSGEIALTIEVTPLAR